MPIYNFADLKIEILPKSNYLTKQLAPYASCEQTADFCASVTKEQVAEAFEKEPEFPPAYHESLCCLRNISNALISNYDGFLFHASTVAYGGKAFAFTAHSGTGKSTHTRLLKELLGEKLVYVNDDKPFVRYDKVQKTFYAYGNCWNGKHELGENIKFPLGGIVFLQRGEVNEVKKINNPLECLPILMDQIFYPENAEQADNLFSLLTELFAVVPFYSLKCNMQSDAPETSFKRILCGEN